MRRPPRISAVFSVILILSVSSLAKDKKSASAPTPDIETRVYLRRQCVLSEPVEAAPKLLPALAAIFVPKLIEKGLTAISTALKRAGSEETLRSSGLFPTYFYRLSYDKTTTGKLIINPDLGCVILIRGKFSTQFDSDGELAIGFNNDAKFTKGVLDKPEQEGERITRLNAAKIPVTELTVVYEAKITVADDGTALNYSSRFLEVNEFQGDRSSDTRAIVVSLSFAGVGAKQGDTTLSLALMNLGEIRKKTILGPGQLGGRKSGWMGGLAASDASLKMAEKVDFGEQKDKVFGIMPVTIEGTLIETEKGSKALLFIADVLDSTKAETTKALSAAVLPAEREKAAKQEEDALESQRQEEETAYTAYLSSLDELAEYAKSASATDTGKAIKQFKVETAKRQWCSKFNTLKKLGLAPTGRPGCP